MITYRITSKSTQSTNSSVKDDPKEKILLKALQKAQRTFPLGATVRAKGSKREGTVMSYRTTVDTAAWKGQKPFFIFIKFHDDRPQNTVLAHSSSIMKVR